MSTTPTELPKFTDLPDLACDNVGGYALACNDDFFASKDNLIRAQAAEWSEHTYGDRGKIMDGWETRRRRFDPAFGHPSHDGAMASGLTMSPDDLANQMAEAHDWCVVRLGLPGVIHGVVVDTAFFRGNYPDSCAIHGATIDDPLDVRALATATWTPILARSKLQGNHKNAFEVVDRKRYTHLRLDIYPDGGVARLRVHGMPAPDWARLRALGGPIDLAALEHGAVVESCSDMFFGSRNNLIKPGNPPNMSDGWETRRRRSPGNDWAVVRLAAPGAIERVLIDTTHFRGNAPGQCMLEGIQALDKSLDQLAGWRTLISTPLQPHTKHVFESELRRIGVVTHLKLSVFPCGGIARLRAWGNVEPDPENPRGLRSLSAMTPADAHAAFLKCCGSEAWATAMTGRRPFDDVPSLLRTAERVWWMLNSDAHREAFEAHPKIGAPKPPSQAGATAAWAKDEQKAAASIDQATADALAKANADYEAKHGFIFIVCATGRTADAMLADLRARAPNSTVVEERTAAEEQIKITRLRLHKLIGELG